MDRQQLKLELLQSLQKMYDMELVAPLLGFKRRALCDEAAYYHNSGVIAEKRIYYYGNFKIRPPENAGKAE